MPTGPLRGGIRAAPSLWSSLLRLKFKSLVTLSYLASFGHFVQLEVLRRLGTLLGDASNGFVSAIWMPSKIESSTFAGTTLGSFM
jgi:hypothetical protein